MALAIAFVELTGAAILLIMAITGAPVGDVLSGQALADYQREKQAGGSTSSTTSTGGGPAPATPGGGYSRQTWAVALLGMLGIKPTQQAVSNVVAWETQEGGHWNNSATYNPLNTTEVPASGSYGNTGAQGNIKAYSSWAQGLAATVATLRNGNYGGILGSLGGSAGEFQAAVNASPWGTHF